MSKEIIEKIKQLTQENNHSEAVVVLATTWGSEYDKKEALRVQELHRELGHISQELSSRRELVKGRVLLRVAEELPQLALKLHFAF